MLLLFCLEKSVINVVMIELIEMNYFLQKGVKMGFYAITQRDGRQKVEENKPIILLLLLSQER